MRVVVVLCLVWAGLLRPVAASAQTSTPAAGAGSVSISFQGVDHTGHLLTDGSYLNNGRSRTAAAYLDVEYGITRRISAAFTLPYVWARYTDDAEPPPGIPFLPVDSCRCWHAALQDFGFTFRYGLVDTLDHAIVLTPTLAVGTPTHDYTYQGEAVVGHRLNEMRIGADGTYRIDTISRNLSATGHYTYAFVEQVLDIGMNRSNASGSVDYQIGRDWSVGGFIAWQRTHGGLRAGAFGSDLIPPGEVNTPERVLEHDRIFRENWTHIGAEASYRLRLATLFGSYTYVLHGTDAHSGHAFLGGITMPFRIRH